MERVLAILGIVVAGFWTFSIAAAMIPVMLVSERWGHEIHRIWAKGFLCFFGVKLVISKLENLQLKPAFVLAPNHESMFDIFVMSSLPINFKYISKREVGWIPLVGWFMRAMGCYFLRRDRSEHDLKVMKRVEVGLQNGRSVLVFPEGTRTRTGELLPFKKGAFRISQNSGVPLCPVAISGTRALAPAGKIPQRWGQKVRVTIGEPFYIVPNKEIGPQMEAFRAVLVAMLNSHA